MSLVSMVCPVNSNVPAVRSIYSVLLALLLVVAFKPGAKGCSWKNVESPSSVGRWISASATSVGDAVAFAGGVFLDPITGQFGNTRNQVATFKPSTSEWKLLPNMTARSSAAAGTTNGRLYVFGGIQKKPNASHSDPDPTIKLSLVESISISPESGQMEKTWRKEKNMPFGHREGQASASLKSGRGIVLAGGFDSGWSQGTFHFEYFNSTFLFDGTSYASMPDMPFKRSNMALVAASDGNGGDVIYAMGGGETDPSYASCALLHLPANDVNAASWKSCGPMVNPRSWMAAGVVGGNIIIAGGMGGEFDATQEVDILSLGESASKPGNWTYANCDLPTPAGFISGASTTTGKSVFVLAAGATPEYGAYVYSPN